MLSEIETILADKVTDAAGYVAVKCTEGSFFVAPNGRGSLPGQSPGSWSRLEVGFPNEYFDDREFRKIYGPVRDMIDFESLTALQVPICLIEEMIEHFGGLAPAQ